MGTQTSQKTHIFRQIVQSLKMTDQKLVKRLRAHHFSVLRHNYISDCSGRTSLHFIIKAVEMLSAMMGAGQSTGSGCQLGWVPDTSGCQQNFLWIFQRSMRFPSGWLLRNSVKKFFWRTLVDTRTIRTIRGVGLLGGLWWQKSNLPFMVTFHKLCGLHDNCSPYMEKKFT